MEKEQETFETKLQKAKTILEHLMSPEITLQESVQAYDEGMKELQEAQQILADAKITIEQIKSRS